MGETELEGWKALGYATADELQRPLEKSVEWLANEDALVRAYAASAAYEGDLAESARRWLVGDALRHDDGTHRGAAARALAKCGDPASGDLRNVLERSSDSWVREAVLTPLIVSLVDEGTASSVRLVLDNAGVGSAPHRELVLKAVAGNPSSKLDRSLCEHLKAMTEHTGPWPAVLIEALTPRPGAGVRKALALALKSWNPDTQGLALVAFGRRADSSTRMDVTRLLANKDDNGAQVNRQAVLTLYALNSGTRNRSRPCSSCSMTARLHRGVRKDLRRAEREGRRQASREAREEREFKS